jgi:hypothetical protein
VSCSRIDNTPANLAVEIAAAGGPETEAAMEALSRWARHPVQSPKLVGRHRARRAWEMSPGGLRAFGVLPIAAVPGDGETAAAPTSTGQAGDQGPGRR